MEDDKDNGADRGQLFVECPHCGEETPVVATVSEWPVVTRLEVPVHLFRDVRGDVTAELRWDLAEIEAELYYHCTECGGSLGDSMDDIRELARKSGTSGG